MTDSDRLEDTDECSPVEQLAEQYLDRLRNGERPHIREYADAHPELADEIHDVFRTLAMLENFAPDHRDQPIIGNILPTESPTKLGEYRIVRELGRGGMGVVYEAEHGAMRRRVALKVLHARAAGKSHDLERFLREARSAGRLHHTNIVPVFEVGVDENTHFYAMQCIRGQNLDLVIADLKKIRQSDASPLPPATNDFNGSAAQCLLSGRFDKSQIREDITADDSDKPATPAPDLSVVEQPVDPAAAAQGNELAVSSTSELSNVGEAQESYFHRVARVGLQVADALAYAHEQGVLHRDIKPANLILDTVGTVWITDFGLARSEDDDLTHTGDIVGTLRYMAPERFRGEADARSDIYSLGLTLYELCTLRYAFDRTERAELIRQVTRQDPVRPRRINSLIPRDLETVILKCIDREPAGRYVTAEHMADDLRLFLADRPVEARRSSLIEQSWRWCRRNPFVSATLACIGLLLGVIFVGTVLFAIRAQEHSVELRAEADRVLAAERETRAANLDALRSLYKSSVDHAKASRWSGRQGQRFETLAAIRKAVDLLPKLEFDEEKMQRERIILRNQAAAALPLVDVHVLQSWPTDGDVRTCISKSGKLTATSDAGGLVSVRDVETGKVIVRLQGPAVQGWMSRFDNSDRFLVTRFHPTSPPTPVTVRVWDIERQRLVLRFDDNLSTGHVAFHPDGERFLIARKTNELETHSLATGDLLESEELVAAPRKIMFAANGDRLMAFGNRIDVKSADSVEVRQIKFPSHIHNFDTNQSGDIVVGCSDDNVYVYDSRSGDISSLKGHTSDVTFVNFSYDSRLIGSDSWDGHRHFYDALTGDLRLRLEGARFGYGGSTKNGLMSFSEQRTRHGIWEVSTGAPFRFIPLQPGSYWQVVAHPTIESIVFVAGQGLGIWDIERAERLAWIDGEYSDARLSTDGSRLYLASVGASPVQETSVAISTDNRGQLLAELGQLSSVSNIDASRPTGRTQHLGLDAAGKILCALDQHGAVVVYDLTGAKQPVRLSGHRFVSRLDLRGDGASVATGTWHGDGIWVWDTVSGQGRELAEGTGDSWPQFSPDGKWLIASSKSGAYRWDTSTWQRSSFDNTDFDGTELPVAISADSRLAVIPRTQFLPRLVDIESGRTIVDLEAPVRGVGYSTFTCSGKYLVSTVSGGLKVWDIELLQQKLREMNLDWEP